VSLADGVFTYTEKKIKQFLYRPIIDQEVSRRVRLPYFKIIGT
jgi:hypothetical protein